MHMSLGETFHPFPEVCTVAILGRYPPYDRRHLIIGVHRFELIFIAVHLHETTRAKLVKQTSIDF
jgi:hypothetical protein